MTSAEQIKPNRKNALKSSGPKSPGGKAIVALNAIQHGVLTSRMLIDGEDAGVFHTLLTQLRGDFEPEALMEEILLERIAAAIWRQRRLVNAETAALSLSSRGPCIADAVSKELDLNYLGKLSEADLSPFDKTRLKWSRSVLKEYDALETLDVESLSRDAPLILEQLQSDAEPENVEKYLKSYPGGLSGYLEELMSWCRKQIADAENRPEILAVAETIRARNQVLPHHKLELFARYQTMLDNQLFKALRALREAQTWRLGKPSGNTREPGANVPS
jgi:hypothetical protein